MNEAHTFPIPELEAHKLDVLQETLSPAAEGVLGATDKWIRSNAWASTLMAGLVGYVAGQYIKRRR
jgi:ElaB/YqjD/DUF883 family membrane-anchored ribosome-binding protein